ALIFPGLAIALTVLAFNFIGDGLREYLDPRQRSRSLLPFVLKQSMRKRFKTLFLVILGLTIGVIGFEAIMFIRISHLQNTNPATTSLIDARIQEAESKGQQPRREQYWVPIDRISPNLQRAVMAGEDTNFLTHHGFDYETVQKAFEAARVEACSDCT